MESILYYDDYRICLRGQGHLRLRTLVEAAEADHVFMTDPHGLFTTRPSSGLVAAIDSLSESDIGVRDKTISVSLETPFVFRGLGMPESEVVAYRSKLAAGLFLYGVKRHGHSESMSKEILKEVLLEFADPLYVFKSRTVGTSLVTSYGVSDKKGCPVITSVDFGRGMGEGRANLITSVYGKALRSEQAWGRADLICYEDDVRGRRLPPQFKLSFHKMRIVRKSEVLSSPWRYMDLMQKT